MNPIIETEATIRQNLTWTFYWVLSNKDGRASIKIGIDPENPNILQMIKIPLLWF